MFSQYSGKFYLGDPTGEESRPLFLVRQVRSHNLSCFLLRSDSKSNDTVCPAAAYTSLQQPARTLPTSEGVNITRIGVRTSVAAVGPNQQKSVDRK